MKKGAKRAVITAIVLIVIGLGLFTAGIVAVGGMAAIKSFGNEQRIWENLLQDRVMESIVTEIEMLDEGTTEMSDGLLKEWKTVPDQI